MSIKDCNVAVGAAQSVDAEARQRAVQNARAARAPHCTDPRVVRAPCTELHEGALDRDWVGALRLLEGSPALGWIEWLGNAGEDFEEVEVAIDLEVAFHRDGRHVRLAADEVCEVDDP